MEDIALIYGSNVQEMVTRLFEKTGALDRLRPHDKVMIKPNLVVSRQGWVGVNTDPRVVESLVHALKDRGVHRITVGDGSGTGHSAAKALKICGYDQLAERYGFRLIDFDRDRFLKKRVPIEGPFKSLEIAQSVVECDLFIDVPVMKAHTETLITCSLKNLKGVMPRAMKTKFHGVNLHKAIAQLASVVPVDLILVDGLRGDLSSETGRTPVQMDRLLVGKNPVEVDSVVADMLGYAPRTIRHIAHSADAGLGTCDLDKIRIRALNRPPKDERFEPPPRLSKRFPCNIHAEGACCTCMGNLIFALERLHEKGLLSKNLHFLIGQKANISSSGAGKTIAVGQCAAKQNAADLGIDACPPTASAIYRSVASANRKT